jgi:hypothetical protein
MLLVSSATMMPTTMYPEGQYQCLRNHTIERLSGRGLGTVALIVA